MHGQTGGEEDSGTVTDHASIQLVVCPEAFACSIVLQTRAVVYAVCSGKPACLAGGVVSKAVAWMKLMQWAA